MALFDWLKPASHVSAIVDKARVRKEYRYWRFRIFYAMFIGYVFYYFTRKSFTFAMSGIAYEFGFNKAQLGIIGSILYITYGVSKFASGVMSDQANPRYFMALGLIITGITNILFGCCSSLWFFALLWGINGWFQGWGWPPCARLLTHWYSQSERGRWWSVWSTSHNVGGFLIPIVVGFCMMHMGWRGAMLIPGILCVLMGFVLMNRLRDTPQSLGLPPIEAFKGDAKVNIENERELSTKEILFGHVLKNKRIWLIALASFFIYVIRIAINDWSALCLMEIKHYGVMEASYCVSLFEVGGLVGMLVAGWISDKLHQSRRGPTNVLFTVGVVLAVFLFWKCAWISVVLDGVLLFIIGFFLFGPQMLLGLFAAELAHKKAAGTASGFAGWFGYFGAACAGYPISVVAEYWGWSRYFSVLLLCGVLAIVLLLPLWKVSSSEETAVT